MAHKGKRIATALESVDKNKLYGLDEAVKLVKANATAKFDETIELAINLGVDPRHADQMVRGVVELPNGTGRAQRVAVFARDEKAEEAKTAGADVVGAEDLVETVQGGTIDFDRCIATPDMMPLVGRVARVLGPRGLMPNPKLGTITTDVAAAVGAAKKGQVEFRTEKNGIVQAAIGKVSFSEDALSDNLQARNPTDADLPTQRQAPAPRRPFEARRLNARTHSSVPHFVPRLLACTSRRGWSGWSGTPRALLGCCLNPPMVMDRPPERDC